MAQNSLKGKRLMMTKINKTIALVGMMGAGKTTVGKVLAEHLGVPFFDNDLEIEKEEGRPITEIFATDGEAYFRQKEREMIAKLAAKNVVLATGGGAYIQDETRKTIDEKTTTIWLKADVEDLYHRVQQQKGMRPLLDIDDPKAKIQELVDQRYPIYAKAEFVVNSGGNSVADVLQSLSEALGVTTLD
ncbi:MAG: shikimate kinase [Alphaproteobacteria bacterium]